jgi:hypothetical protein
VRRGGGLPDFRECLHLYRLHQPLDAGVVVNGAALINGQSTYAVRF